MLGGMEMESQTIYLVILCSAWGSEYVDMIFRDSSDADEYKRTEEERYARMSDSPPRLRIDERALR